MIRQAPGFVKSASYAVVGLGEAPRGHPASPRYLFLAPACGGFAAASRRQLVNLGGPTPKGYPPPNLPAERLRNFGKPPAPPPRQRDLLFWAALRYNRSTYERFDHSGFMIQRSIQFCHACGSRATPRALY